MKKNKNKSSKTIGCIAFIIILLLSLRVIFWTFKEYKNSVWDGRTNLAVAFRGKDYLLAFGNKNKSTLYVIKIPENSLFHYKSGGSEYCLNSIWRLEKMAKNGKPDLRPSFQDFFGVPVAAQYENEKMGFDDFDVKLIDIIFGKTNLTIFDYINIKKLLPNIEKINLSGKIIPKKKLIKEEENLKFDPDDIDRLFKDVFNDLFLADFKYNFKIVGVPARQSAVDTARRMTANIGWKVSDIEMKDSDKIQNINSCVMRKPGELDEYIAKIFDCRMMYDENIRYSVTVSVL